MATECISVSCVPHLLPSNHLIEISLHVLPVPVPNKINPWHFIKAKKNMSVSGDQTLNEPRRDKICLWCF